MKNKTEIQLVVFDLGGVLFDWNPKNLFKNIFKDESDMEYFLTHVCNHDWNIQQDKGRPFATAIKERCEKFPHLEKEIKLYYSRWIDMLGGQIDSTVKLLEDVKAAGYRAAALSNWSAETFVLIRDLYPFLKHFEPLLISGDVKMIKPELEFYELLLDRVKLPPEACVFIDDVKVNIEAAEKVGMKGVQYFSTDQVRADLKNLGVLIA